MDRGPRHGPRPGVARGGRPDRPSRQWQDRGSRPFAARGDFDGPRPGFDGSPPDIDGPRPQFDAPEPPTYRAVPALRLEEGEELIAGRRPVEEAFTAGRPPRRLLVTPQRRQALERIVLHATTLRIPIVEVEGGSLTALAGFDGHQGVAVVVEARRFASLDDILARSIERAEPAFILALDSLEDPQNVGTLLRSAEAAGVHGVLFPTERQAPLSPAAIKASAGATEHLLLAPIDDLAGALTDLHLRGLRIVGSEADAALTGREADLRGPIALVIGSEGHGLSPSIRRRCDLFVRIPMRGSIGSLNAAVAGSVLLFEVIGQRSLPAATGESVPVLAPKAPRKAAPSKAPVPKAPAPGAKAAAAKAFTARPVAAKAATASAATAKAATARATTPDPSRASRPPRAVKAMAEAAVEPELEPAPAAGATSKSPAKRVPKAGPRLVASTEDAAETPS